MRQVTASTGGLLRECGYSFRTDVMTRPGPSSDEQSRGTLCHGMVETYGEQGVILPTDDIDAATMFGHARRWLDATPDDGAGRVFEVPVWWDPETDTGGCLSAAIRTVCGEAAPHRAYALPGVWEKLVALGIPATAVPMTLDLLEGTHVYDWCFGRTDKTAQLELQALAVSRAFGRDSVTVTTLRVDASGLREEGTRTLDAFDFAVLAG